LVKLDCPLALSLLADVVTPTQSLVLVVNYSRVYYQSIRSSLTCCLLWLSSWRKLVRP